jgi:LysR family glycine cleavage system transcriptional activator
LGNLSRAAAAMNLTVSALSHQMRQLEERLGHPLLVRQPRGVTLTLRASACWNRWARIWMRSTKPSSPMPRAEHVLTISAVPSMASAWLVPRLGHFVAAHPQIEINLQSSERLIDFERQRQFDAALRLGSGQWPGLVVEPLFDEWLLPMASPALIERMGGTDRAAEPMAAAGRPRWCGAHGLTERSAPPSRFVAVLDDSEAHHRAALDGVGVALGRVTRAPAAGLRPTGGTVQPAPENGLAPLAGLSAAVCPSSRLPCLPRLAATHRPTSTCGTWKTRL